MSKHSLPPNRKHKKETVKTEDAKAHVSFLAFFTHDPEIQPKLPQIFIGNKHKFTAKLLKELAPHPRRFFFYGAKSPLGIMLYS